MWQGRFRASTRSISPSAKSVSISSTATSSSDIPVQPDVITSWAWYSSAGRPTAPALTRSGMSLETNVTRLPSAARLAATRQDPGVVGVGAEAQRQHRRVGVIQFDLKRSTLCPNRNGLIEATVLEAKVVEQPQRLPGEPAQLMMVALGFQFADHHERYHHFVFGEPVARPRIGQQDRGVEHVSPTVGRQRLGHGALL